ncbi:MAG: hypothetical protein R3E12_14185 [Candidatus Eisenbacteria bacterium]
MRIRAQSPGRATEASEGGTLAPDLLDQTLALRRTVGVEEAGVSFELRDAGGRPVYEMGLQTLDDGVLLSRTPAESVWRC